MTQSKRPPVVTVTAEMQAKMEAWAIALNLTTPSDGCRLFFARFERQMDEWVESFRNPSAVQLQPTVTLSQASEITDTSPQPAVEKPQPAVALPQPTVKAGGINALRSLSAKP
jgi:hypothetical protein